MSKLITKVLFGGIISILIIVVVVIAIVSSKDSPENSSLQLVAILHRHGFRTPTSTYKNDPYQEDAWPVAWGQLLKKGKQQLYKLGKTFKERYKSYMTKYSSTTVRVRTSDVDRCHMSVAVLLAAWFPPKDEEAIWNEELAWQPIPIHTVPRNEDNILAQDKPCPRYDLEKKKVIEQIKANETQEDKDLYKYLTEKAGEEINSPRDVEVMYITSRIEEIQGLKLPEWINKFYPEEMKKKAEISVATFQWTKLLKRLSAGPLINELLSQFTKKSIGESKDLKLLLYSAHDTTISSIWQTLEFDGVLMPDFGSSMTFELHKSNTDQYFVKMFLLNNTELTEPRELQIPNCSSPCFLNMLYKITEDVRPVDWDKECAIT